MPQVQICRGFGHRDLEALLAHLTKTGYVQLKNRAWRRAVRVFQRRMNERFFSCIKTLEEADSGLKRIEIEDDDVNPDRPFPHPDAVTPGFAIMGLCCLLVESLALFFSLQGNDRERFIAFLQLPAFEKSFSNPEIAQAFWDGIRNGIVHQTETRKWLIRRQTSENRIVDKQDEILILNRRRFLSAVRKEYASYLRRLRSDSEVELRADFARRLAKLVRRVASLS